MIHVEQVLLSLLNPECSRCGDWTCLVAPGAIKRQCSSCFVQSFCGDPRDIVALRSRTYPTNYGVLAPLTDVQQHGPVYGQTHIRMRDNPRLHTSSALAVEEEEDGEEVGDAMEVDNEQEVHTASVVVDADASMVEEEAGLHHFSFILELWSVYPSIRLTGARHLMVTEIQQANTQLASNSDPPLSPHIDGTIPFIGLPDDNTMESPNLNKARPQSVSVRTAAELQLAVREINQRWTDRGHAYSSIFPFSDLQPLGIIVVRLCPTSVRPWDSPPHLLFSLSCLDAAAAGWT